MNMTIKKASKRLSMITSKCWIERGFGGYMIDILTAGSYTTYRTFHYSKCMDEALKEAEVAVRQSEKTKSPALVEKNDVP